MESINQQRNLKLGWTLSELATSLSVSVPFLRLEVKRGRLKAAHLGRRVVLPDSEVQRYLANASDAGRGWR
jgi:excisionase family DNA binding protein